MMIVARPGCQRRCGDASRRWCAPWCVRVTDGAAAVPRCVHRGLKQTGCFSRRRAAVTGSGRGCRATLGSISVGVFSTIPSRISLAMLRTR